MEFGYGLWDEGTPAVKQTVGNVANRTTEMRTGTFVKPFPHLLINAVQYLRLYFFKILYTSISQTNLPWFPIHFC